MSGARRVVLFAALLAPLLLAAVLLSRDGVEHESSQPQGTRPSHLEGAPSAPQLRARAAERIARADIRREADAARREDPHGEPGPTARVLRLYERTRAAAEPVARCFFAAFSLYEVGRLDEEVGPELRAAATSAFAGQLLSAPPRVPPGLSKPERAHLARLEFVPGEPSDAGTRLVTGELVGLVHRGAGSETLAIELRRRPGGWRVSGLGR
ncbi:MAG: hypothetical protein AABM66_03820 [Actinomycetota bacterium]